MKKNKIFKGTEREEVEKIVTSWGSEIEIDDYPPVSLIELYKTT